MRFDISEKAESELENMRLLHHDNLIKLYSYFTEGGLYLCLVMELADVGSLGDAVINEANQSSQSSSKSRSCGASSERSPPGLFVCLVKFIHTVI